MSSNEMSAEKAVVYTAQQLATLSSLLERFNQALVNNTDALRDLERELSRHH